MMNSVKVMIKPTRDIKHREIIPGDECKLNKKKGIFILFLCPDSSKLQLKRIYLFIIWIIVI
jgi:hypothetical protein